MDSSGGHYTVRISLEPDFACFKAWINERFAMNSANLSNCPSSRFEPLKVQLHTLIAFERAQYSLHYNPLVGVSFKQP